MGLATIISILGFGIALVALWLVSDVLKKVESQNAKFLRAHITVLREEIRSSDEEIAKVAKSVKALGDNFEAIDKRFNDHTNDIEGVRTRITKVAEDLDLLDRSIPQRFRARVVPPAEPDTKAVVKPKPTMQ